MRELIDPKLIPGWKTLECELRRVPGQKNKDCRLQGRLSRPLLTDYHKHQKASPQSPQTKAATLAVTPGHTHLQGLLLEGGRYDVELRGPSRFWG